MDNIINLTYKFTSAVKPKVTIGGSAIVAIPDSVRNLVDVAAGSVKHRTLVSEYQSVCSSAITGFQSVLFGGRRYDSPGKDESIISGNQSFGAGGSLKVFSDFSGVFGKQNTIYANSGFAAGGGNIVGLDNDVNSSEAQGAYAFGMGGRSYGYGSGTLGTNNKATSRSATAIGSDNESHSNAGVAIGSRHIINEGASAAVVIGEYNIVKENCKRACGVGYYLRLNAVDAIGIGSQNIVSGERAISIGYLSEARATDAYAFGVKCISNNPYSFAGGYGSVTNNGGAFLYGYKLKSYKSYQTIFGVRNAQSTARFVVAAGSEDDSNPIERNIFEVYDDGRAKVYGAPVDNDDVVRKIDVSSVITYANKLSNYMSVGNNNLSLGTSTAKARYSTSIGFNNVANNEYSFSGGYESSTNNGGSFVYGIGLKTGKSYQTVFGKGNVAKNNAIFIIGNGAEKGNSSILDTERRNAFEVLTDNRAKVYGVPTEADDVVRFKELSDAQTTLNDSIDTKLDKWTNANTELSAYVISRGENQVRSIASNVYRISNGNIAMYFGNTINAAPAPDTVVLVTGTPTQDKHAANKKYVDDAINELKQLLNI